MAETTILRRIQVALSNAGARLFRNQVGTYQLMDGRWISSGLVQGSSDLIGWQTREITPKMVGRRLALFVAVEIKTPRGRLTEEQKTFIAAVRDAGGLAFVASSPDEALAQLQGDIA